MRLLSFVLGMMGNATAILVQLSPLPTFWQIVKMKATGSFSAQPYLFSLLSALLWTYYGVLSVRQGGVPLITINAASTTFQLTYLAIYLRYATKSQRIKTCFIFLIIILSFGVVIFVTIRANKPHDSLFAVGIMSTISGVLSSAAPLCIMHKVIKTASVEFMPFTLSLCLFINGVTWLAYALSIKDVFQMIPNAIGTILAIAQLVLYAFYRYCGANANEVCKEPDETWKAWSTMYTYSAA